MALLLLLAVLAYLFALFVALPAWTLADAAAARRRTDGLRRAALFGVLLAFWPGTSLL